MNEWMKIVGILKDSSMHFILAFCAGVAGYLLTQITCYAVLWPIRLKYHWPALPPQEVNRYIRIGALVCALSLAVFSHIALDWLNAPITAPIVIVDSSKGATPQVKQPALILDLHSPLDPYPDNALTPTPTDVPADWNKP